MTSLRTMEGLDIALVSDFLKEDPWRDWHSVVEKFVDDKMVLYQDGFIKLNAKGKLFADYIAGELFV